MSKLNKSFHDYTPDSVFDDSLESQSRPNGLYYRDKINHFGRHIYLFNKFE